jgi:hypothetical protein
MSVRPLIHSSSRVEGVCVRVRAMSWTKNCAIYGSQTNAFSINPNRVLAPLKSASKTRSGWLVRPSEIFVWWAIKLRRFCSPCRTYHPALISTDTYRHAIIMRWCCHRFVISTCTSACTLFNTEGMPRSLFDFESIFDRHIGCYHHALISKDTHHASKFDRHICNDTACWYHPLVISTDTSSCCHHFWHFVSLPLPNEDFGRLYQPFRMLFRSTFQGREY